MNSALGERLSVIRESSEVVEEEEEEGVVGKERGWLSLSAEGCEAMLSSESDPLPLSEEEEERSMSCD